MDYQWCIYFLFFSHSKYTPKELDLPRQRAEFLARDNADENLEVGTMVIKPLSSKIKKLTNGFISFEKRALLKKEVIST